MMLLTSSRKPSFKTKILCKKLALFFDAAYMTRGKMPLSEVLEQGSGAVLCIVGEYHGNPGSLSFYDPSGHLFLSLRFSETSFDPVPQAELRYGERIFYGAESSEIFNLLSMFMIEDKGLSVPPDSLIELFKNNKNKKDKRDKTDTTDKTTDTTDKTDKTDSAPQSATEVSAEVPAKVRAIPWVFKGDSKPKPNAAYVRRLYVTDDRLDFYSNDRLFLRLYVKGIKSDVSN
ncbi:hypothetical protein MmiHf6_05310 [Methanimicrococcus hongohii]|uniref:Uncharacterized protein n=1 Tax=Methanimicrococcus hongohii TaxID=3028295 RepID=A0AA96ZTH3_9EURY|nr:hypothetical protein [Methanimicrococcus sp. Hf6]WNY23226.1 hypothetical protein MmiHf6_05310 [Methanimicrococcus sp. Hf6]